MLFLQSWHRGQLKCRQERAESDFTCWETRRKGGRLHPFGSGVVLCLGLQRNALEEEWLMSVYAGTQAFGAICGS